MLKSQDIQKNQLYKMAIKIFENYYFNFSTKTLHKMRILLFRKIMN